MGTFPTSPGPIAFPFCLQGGPGMMSQKGVPGLSWAKAFGQARGGPPPRSIRSPPTSHRKESPSVGQFPPWGRLGPSLTWDT